MSKLSVLAKAPLSRTMKDAFTARPWGGYQIVSTAPSAAVKLLTVAPLSRLSLQTHAKRSEKWIPLTAGASAVIGGDLVFLEPLKEYEIGVGVQHRLINAGLVEVTILEILYGEYDEDDIVRIEDDFGRTN